MPAAYQNIANVSRVADHESEIMRSCGIGVFKAKCKNVSLDLAEGQPFTVRTQVFHLAGA